MHLWKIQNFLRPNKDSNSVVMFCLPTSVIITPGRASLLFLFTNICLRCHTGLKLAIMLVLCFSELIWLTIVKSVRKKSTEIILKLLFPSLHFSYYIHIKTGQCLPFTLSLSSYLSIYLSILICSSISAYLPQSLSKSINLSLCLCFCEHWCTLMHKRVYT